LANDHPIVQAYKHVSIGKINAAAHGENHHL
jgi:hypothetical protein